MAKKKQKEKFSKWIYVIIFTILIIFNLLYIKNLDNDIWYLLSEGRYIVQNGLYNIDPLSMHEGLNVVVQNWFSASLFWVIYDFFGEMGLVTLIVVCNFFICLLLYKICMLISDKNRLLSLLVMFAADISLISHFIVSRPQILSFITLLSLIYVLELYIKTEKSKYLIWIPVLSFIQINMHASLWWMLFLFMLPYVIDSFKIPFLKTQGYKKKPLFIAIIIALLVGFINPYGYKAITFIFTSYGDKYMHIFINELLPFKFSGLLCKHMFIIILTIGLIYTFFREGNIRIRYICLFCGTLILGFMSVKGFSHFLLVSIFPLAYFFKDMFPKDFTGVFGKYEKGLKGLLICVTCVFVGIATYLYIDDCMNVKLTHNAEEAMDTIEKYFDSDTSKIYSSFNNGGYVEFRGYKPYIDPRAELYLEKNNKKADLFKENYDLQHGLIDIDEFLEKYKFTALLVEKTDYIYSRLSENENYFVIYDNYKTGYRVYIRSELFDKEEREKIIAAYKEAIENAKKEESNS